MLDQNTIDRVIDAANIVDVVSDYVTLRRAGANYKGLCPFHEDKTPSFHVSPAKGICKCFACGEGGNAVHFIMKMEQLQFFDAIKFLGKKYGIDVEDKELSPEQRQQMGERESLFAVNEWASKYYNKIMHTDPDGRAIGLAYFRSRGFRDDIIEKFRLGFSLDKWDSMTKAARQAGYKDEYLVKANLSFRRENTQGNTQVQFTDKFRGRVMFPWFNVSGKVVAFGGRVLDARTKGVSQKYVNTSETPIYVKGRELYGIFQAKKQIAKEDRVFMVEGYTDVLSMHQCGIENVVANSGTALTESQIRLLHRFTSNITLLYDGDEAGIHAALRGTDMLLAEGMNVKILLLPDGDDPDSFARKHNATEFKEYVEANQTDFIIFKTNLLLKDAGRDPLKRAELTKSIVYSISVIPEEIIRSAYVHECAELMHTDEAMLLREIDRNKAAAIEKLRKEKEIEAQRQKSRDMREFVPDSSQPADQSLTQAQPESAASQAMTEEDAMDAYYSSLADSIPAEIQSQDAPVQQQSADSGNVRVTSAADSVYSEADKRFIGLERMIMQIVVRHGEQMVQLTDNDGAPYTESIAEYVAGDLASDGIKFRSTLYSTMLSLAKDQCHGENFVAKRFFLNNPDLQISQEAAALLTDRYHLSKVQQEQVQPDEELALSQVEHMLLDYKFAYLDAEMKNLQQQMNDPATCMKAMQDYMELKNLQLQLAKHLGDRILC